MTIGTELAGTDAACDKLTGKFYTQANRQELADGISLQHARIAARCADREDLGLGYAGTRASF
jgi:hypothetical protein